MTPSRRMFLLAASGQRLLDRLGLGRSRLVRRLAGAARRRFFSEQPGLPRSVRVRTNGLVLEVPERFLPHYVHRRYEPLTSRWLRGTVAPGMRVADVGAHIGYFSLLLATLVGEGGEVYAVEPAEENLRFLERNLAANRLTNVSVLPVAAGTKRRRRRFNLTGSSDSHGFYDHPFTSTAETCEVAEVPLDELLAAPVDLVKIDVEGAELEVLAGMSRLLEETPELRLVVEWNPACLRAAGYEPQRLPLELESHGFQLSLLDERAGRARAVQEVLTALREGAIDSAWYGNLVCTRGAR